jgi:hypothetical protein
MATWRGNLKVLAVVLFTIGIYSVCAAGLALTAGVHQRTVRRHWDLKVRDRYANSAPN